MKQYDMVARRGRGGALYVKPIETSNGRYVEYDAIRDMIEETRWRSPEEVPVYTTQAGGTQFVRVLLCIDNQCVSEGLYINGQWELCGIVVPSITKWKPIPKP